VNNNLHITSTEQSAHENSVNKILSTAHFLTQIFAAAHSFKKKQFFLFVSYLISMSCLVYKVIGIENDSNPNTQ